MSEPRSPTELWAAEYQAGGVPSSVRIAPSGAVVWAVGALQRRNFPLRIAVDVGCGRGRNSLFLAAMGLRVTALDFTANAIAALTQEAKKRRLDDKIRAVVHDVVEPWPIGGQDVDLVIDTFCFKHITQREWRQGYKQHLLDVLSVRGHYLISFASVGDGYYGRYTQPTDVASGAAMVVDPVNGIPSVLFSREAIVKFFAPELVLLDELKNNKPVVIHGATYERETYALLFRRSPRHFVS